MKKNLGLFFTTAIILVEIIFVFVGSAAAHKPSDSYLTLRIDGDRVDGRWDIALRDLDHAIGLDLDQDGQLSWGEVKQNHGRIAAFALARLSLGTEIGPCRLSARPQLVENHSDGPHTVLPFTAFCNEAIEALSIRYTLLFDLDPLHRGLLRIEGQKKSVSAVLSPDSPTYLWKVGQGTVVQDILTYGREGVWHILIGFDHILFLLCLLLPAALRRVDGKWQRVACWRQSFWPVVQTVTAFSLAHTVTLCASALGLLSLPAWLVESAIAASIIAAALNNIWPLVTRHLWFIAFGFGLIHGFGFAGVLADLGLPRDTLVASLLGFNLGIEFGQLAIVALVLPLIHCLGLLRSYSLILMPAGSALTAIIAVIWFFERVTETAVF